jgi:hypothetical protein
MSRQSSPRGVIAIPFTKVIPANGVPGIRELNLRVAEVETVNLPDGVDHGRTAWAPPNRIARCSRSWACGIASDGLRDVAEVGTSMAAEGELVTENRIWRR